jgi:hypothetical protein
MMHTVEIARRPIAIMNASFPEAEEWFRSEAFKKELAFLRDGEGRPLWAGNGDLWVRRSSDEEMAQWDAARTAGDADEEDKAGCLVFLLPVTDARRTSPETDLSRSLRQAA